MNGDVMNGDVVNGDEMSSDERTPTRLERWLGKRVQNDESGLALVWMSLFLMVLIGFAALAVDIGHGYQVAQRAQNAADAAALAGTIYLPGDLPTAQGTAMSVAASNGFTNGSNGVTVTAVRSTAVSQLQVTVTQDVKTWFAKAIGFSTMHVSRKAVADYRPPVSMGSPSNQYGDDPDSGGGFGSITYPNFWGNIAGPSSPKANGDAYQAGGSCAAADSCSQAPADVSCGYAGTNTDYACDGYIYTVHLTSAVPSLTLQAFDPGFVAVGDTCGANDDGSNLKGADALAKAQIQGWPVGVADNLAARYLYVADSSKSNDPGYRYCTGDHNFGDPNITTTYTVLGPAAIPGDPTSAPTTPICTKSYPGYDADLAKGLIAPTPAMQVTVNGVLTPEYLGHYFRQWDNLCPSTVNAKAGDYFIQVRTNLTTNGQPTQIGNGHNRFALRATGGSNIGIYGNGKMGIYANIGGGALTQFYLARLLPGDAGHTLTLSLFDIGDGGSNGTLTIVPPPDSNVSTGALTGCTMQLGISSTYQPVNGSGCQVTGVNTTDYGGKWLTVEVPIPSNYTCDVSNANNCWFRIQYQFDGFLNDTTSWTASLGGDPVRIIK